MIPAVALVAPAPASPVARRPRLTVASTANATENGLRVTVREIAFYERYATVLATFVNLGERGVTILPFGRSALRDGVAVYRVFVTRDAGLADPRLVIGVRLAPNAQIRGRLAFALPSADVRPHRVVLTVGPNVLDGGEVPFSVELPPIALP